MDAKVKQKRTTVEGKGGNSLLCCLPDTCNNSHTQRPEREKGSVQLLASIASSGERRESSSHISLSLPSSFSILKKKYLPFLVLLAALLAMSNSS